MRPQLEASLGATISQEIGEVLGSMTGLFDENFSLLRSRIDKLEENLINAIK